MMNSRPDDIVGKSIESISKIFGSNLHDDELRTVINALYNYAQCEGRRVGYEEGLKDGKAEKDRRVVAHLN